MQCVLVKPFSGATGHESDIMSHANLERLYMVVAIVDSRFERIKNH